MLLKKFSLFYFVLVSCFVLPGCGDSEQNVVNPAPPVAYPEGDAAYEQANAKANADADKAAEAYYKSSKK